MLTSGLGADIVVVCTHFPLWRVLSMESFQSSTSYESDKLERPTVISNSPGMQPSSAVRPIVNGKVSAFRSTMREPGIKRSEEHTSELQSLMRISYAVFCLKKKKHKNRNDVRIYIDQRSNIKNE